MAAPTSLLSALSANDVKTTTALPRSHGKYLREPSKEKSVLNIALIGCGAIGSSILEFLRTDARIRTAAIVVPASRIEAARAVACRFAPAAAVQSAVPCGGVDLVVEVAGHSAIEEHVLPALERGVPCMMASVGALSAAGWVERLEAAARAGGTQVQLIAGAIGAIDALAAARVGGLEVVHYTGRKPPGAWAGTPAEQDFDLGTLTRETVIFQGSAREASLLYPKNANVAAAVSLAGVGLDRTQVRLVADPRLSENVHTVEARGAFGQFELTMRNKALETNPKTSALAVYSAIRALRNRVTSICI